MHMTWCSGSDFGGWNGWEAEQNKYSDNEESKFKNAQENRKAGDSRWHSMKHVGKKKKTILEKASTTGARRPKAV
jgi:hypothetical protein